MSQKIIISHNNSDLYKTATYASNYAKELRIKLNKNLTIKIIR